MSETDGFDEWVILDLFGHQRFAGRVRKAEFPSDFLRLDVPATPGFEGLTQLISPKAVYAMTPTTEEIATAVAARCRPEPVQRWELPALGASAQDDAARDAWDQEGRAIGAEPDPDYGKDIDGEFDDHEEDDDVF